MWQKGGSSSVLYLHQAKKYISRLNEQKFSGYNDWRIPTSEELASLLERDPNNEGLHIDSIFYSRQKECWSSDQDSGSHGDTYLNRVVSFSDASMDTKVARSMMRYDRASIRAVRTIQRGESTRGQLRERRLQTVDVGTEIWELELTGDAEGTLELMFERGKIEKNIYSVRGKLSGLVQDYQGGPLELRCKLDGKMERNIILADFTGYAGHVEIGSVFVTGTIRGAISKSKGLGTWSIKHSLGSSVGEWTMRKVRAYE